MKLHWTVSHLVSSLHAARAVAEQRRLTDEKLAEILAQPTRALVKEISAYGLPADQLWQHLLTYSSKVEDHYQLALTVLRKTLGTGGATDSRLAALASRTGEVQAAVEHAVPQLHQQLLRRVRPLCEQWDARGPGLMRSVRLLTDERLVVDQADVVLVHPVLGGGGAAHLLTNSVRIEAVLTNVSAELPEVTRLGWLLAQLNCDLPIFSEAIAAERLPTVAALATVPVALAAAEQVELAAFDPAAVHRALTCWHLADGQKSKLADILWRWWQTYAELRPSWEVALADLDRTVHQACSRPS